MKGAKNKIRQGGDILAIIGTLFISLYVISLFIPIVWAVLTSLKGNEDFYYHKFALPEVWEWDNYSTAMTKMCIWVSTGKRMVPVYTYQMFFNSIIYTVGCTLASVFVHAFVAYGAARYDSFVGRLLHKIVLVTMVIPAIGTLPSEMQLVRALGFYNNMLGMFIMKGQWLGMDFLIFYAAFKGVSKDYSDAASLDGAGHFRIMVSVIFPLVFSTISTLALLSAIGFWNDHNTSLTYMPNIPTIAYGLFRYQFSTDNDITSIPMQLAGCMIVVIPIMIIFVIFRNKLIMNVNVGGLKG
jgi:multiple sugar transport system permease protein